MTHLSLLSTVAVLLALFAAGSTKGLLGIGMPIVAVPLLNLIVDLRVTVVLLAIPLHDFVVLGDEAGEVTPTGMEFLTGLGVDLAAARAKRRVFCRPCLDWTERRPHIGGAVGAALAKRCLELKWIEQVRDSRALAITPAGRRGLLEAFGLSL